MEVTKPPLFSKKIKKVSTFVNIVYLYLRMKITKELELTKITQVLSYVQRGVAEAWKDNLLDKLSKGESEIKIAEELFSKIRNKFRKTVEKKRKVKQLRTIEQREKTCDKYIQEFKKIAKGNGYKRQSLIEKFKRELSGEIRRKLAKTESPSCIIEEQQKRLVRLDRNQRQSRTEQRILERNTAYLQKNIQPREGFRGGLYRNKEEQIV